MKRKKLLSTAVAGMLVAAQMVMPVMAADGGEVNAPIDVTKVVIRVNVPTSLVVSVNQFEKNDTGSQITSDSFIIENRSEIPVWVTVDSTLSKANSFELKAKRDDAKNSNVAAGEAWVGVVAQYQAETGANITSDDYAKTGDQFADLDEASENVDTFVDASDKLTATVQQEFYLAKPSTTNVEYTSFIPKEDGKADVAYARFYALTKITGAGTELTQAELDAKIKVGDVYSMAAGDADAANKTMHLIEKGSTTEVVDTPNTKVYYEVSTTETPAASLDTSKFYVYAQDAVGGKTSFRYIGSLSDSKPTWTATDFSNMHIAYDIKGLTDTKYTTAVNDNSLIYGYVKKAPADVAPSISTTTYNYDRTATFDITADLGSGNKKATTIAKVEASADGTTPTADYTSKCTISGNKVTIPAGQFPGASVGDTKYLIITFDDTVPTKVTLTLSITN